VADQRPISVRLDEATVTALAMTAESVGLTGGVSDALRLAADALIHMSDEQLQKLMKCPICNGTGKRRPLAGVPLDDEEEKAGG
jgi:hypothetical protein